MPRGSASSVRREIEALGIAPTDFTFIDYGSGKGRVLLVAAEFPFRQVIGIEFARELHDIAAANILRLPASMTTGARVHSVHADAAETSLPEGNLVCYFHNPFGRPVIKRVRERLIAHAKGGHRVIIVYVVPRHRESFEHSGIFFLRKDTPHTLVFDTLAPGSLTEQARE